MKPETVTPLCLRAADPCEWEALTALWEASVRATHDFLPEAAIAALRPQVRDQFLPAVAVTVCTDGAGQVLGVSGVADDRLEMLFVAPAARGHGAGWALLRRAVLAQGVRAVDVNEQNPPALGFYQRAGFAVTGRSELDGQGQPYPLLHLRRPLDQPPTAHALPLRVRAVPGGAVPVLVCAGPVEIVEDAHAILSGAREHGAHGVLLHEAQLPPDFFRLSTGFAGEFIQKLLNYRVAVALMVGAAAGDNNPHYAAYIAEARRGRQFRSFDDADAAQAWLQTQ